MLMTRQKRDTPLRWVSRRDEVYAAIVAGFKSFPSARCCCSESNAPTPDGAHLATGMSASLR